MSAKREVQLGNWNINTQNVMYVCINGTGQERAWNSFTFLNVQRNSSKSLSECVYMDKITRSCGNVYSMIMLKLLVFNFFFKVKLLQIIFNSNVSNLGPKHWIHSTVVIFPGLLFDRFKTWNLGVATSYTR